MQPDALADMMGLALDTALTPLVSEVMSLRAQVAVLQQRPAIGAAEMHALVDEVTTLRKAMSAMGERVAVVEVTLPMPGPPGPPGKDGLNGKDGTAGLRFAGVYVEGTTYELGDLVTWAGSSWHCNGTTTSKPGEGAAAWTLMVKRGRDGKDARP